MNSLNINTELQNGKYRIIRVLGQGGFGITYLAEHTMLDKMVAIKEFFPKEYCDRDSSSHLTIGTQNNVKTVENLKTRFLKEARNIATLDHSYIVSIHDIFQENNTAYYVMDYIEGVSLSEMVKRSGPLSEAKAVEYIQKIGEALEYIHSRHMTHFDVKPANIMVRSSDDTPLLIDFGLSKQYDVHGDATSTLMQGVSHGYSPIELYNEGDLTSFSPQTDIYSLGATLYFLITGTIPPAANTILEEGVKLPVSITTTLAEVIRSAMYVTRSKRPATINVWLTMLSSKPINTLQNQYEGSEYFVDESTQILNTGLNNSLNRQTETNRLKSKSTPSIESSVFESSHASSTPKSKKFGTVLIILGILAISIGTCIWVYFNSELTHFQNSSDSVIWPMPQKPEL